MPTIDRLDEQILEQLLEDGRKSFVEIGKVCNTPYEVIIKRYKEMKKKGIIIGATNQINYRFYGIRYMGSISIDTNDNPEELIKFLHTIPNVVGIRSAIRKFGITAILQLTNIQEIEEIKDKIRKDSPIAVLSLDSNLWVDIRNMPENLFLSNKTDKIEKENSSGKNKQELIEFDDIDIKLIGSLSRDARRPFSKIASEIGTSVDTVIRRYERLVKRKVLKTVIQIDPRKIDYQAQAAFYISIQSKGSMEQTVNSLSKIRNVYQLTKTMGDADLFLLALVKDFNEYFALREEIAKQPALKLLRSEVNTISPVFPGPSLHMSTF
jgi:Lrp/AsnC family transcriptional regulator, regulator for asnA, asnC and gidA